MNGNAITAASGITSATGDIKATAGKLIAGTLDAVADATAGNTALSIGSNVIIGNIVIGSSQTTGDIIIGQSDITGATITIGTSSTATTINGSINAVNVLTATGGTKSLDYDVSTVGSDFQIARSQTTGAIYIGHNQTSAALNIGCGTGTSRIAGGDINIGTNGSGTSVGNVNIGYTATTTTVNSKLTSTGLLTANGSIKTSNLDPLTPTGNLDIGSTQTTGAISIGQNKTGGFITLGNTNTGQSVITNAPATFHRSITLDGGDGIATTTTTYTAGSTNIGYQSSAVGTAIGTITTTSSAACLTISNLAVGFYIITFSGNITGFSTTVNYAQPTITITGGASGVNNINKYNVGSTTGTTGFLFTGPVQITSSTNSITLTFAMAPSGTANMSATPSYSYIRIA